MENIKNKMPDEFGSLVFDDRVMKANLTSDVYKKLKKTMDEGASIDPSVADSVATAMKTWAVDHGATHYSHWFQPLTGITAEKHDSFIAPAPDGGVIMEFSGKELIKGEPDASSFPSGGIRATCEARGYTAWDPTSYAFIKDKTLCIPTAFCSYTGEALDKKTPLLRSMEALNKQAMRILRLFGNDTAKAVRTSVGPEQEYFLVDKGVYDQRWDLVFTGRTLYGAKPPKGQELDDYYFGVITPRVTAFMEDFNDELWKFGILAKTEHNEVAPAQHELAPIHTSTNIATDNNQLMMEIMQKIAEKHGLVCLLHEKPFDGVNGSGKHNNWSISTDTGVNLLSPGKTPYENTQFLLFLVAVIQAVHEYQDLLRLSVASAGNDHRLGANEAPPAVVSIFLGDELSAILHALEDDVPYEAFEKELMSLNVSVLPDFKKDTTDRNRTSPFAFTGNRFEFRMVGSTQTTATANTVLNSITAQVLKEYADELEGASDFDSAVAKLIQRTIKEHKAIIFNGDGYDDAWIKEATEERGLLNLKTTVDAAVAYKNPKNRKMFQEMGVYSEIELDARYEILLETYTKNVLIEANTMVDMAKRQIMPAISAFTADLSSQAATKMSVVDVACGYEKKKIGELSVLLDEIDEACTKLEATIAKVYATECVLTQAELIRDEIIPDMAALRAPADKAETLCSTEYWPFPTYSDLLYRQ